MGPQYAPFRDLHPSIAKSEGVTLLPFLLAGVAGYPALNQADFGMHPNVRGERTVAANVWRGWRRCWNRWRAAAIEKRLAVAGGATMHHRRGSGPCG